MPSPYTAASSFEAMSNVGALRPDSTEPAVSVVSQPQPPRSDVVELRPVIRVDVDATYAEARRQAIHDFERIYVQGLLVRSRGNVSKAARDAKIDRVYLHRLIRRHRTQRNVQDA